MAEAEQITTPTTGASAEPASQTGAGTPTETLLNGQEKETDTTLLAGAEGGEGGTEGDKAGGAEVPEAYTFDVPDDLKTDVNDDTVKAMLSEFSPKAKELGLTQEQFQGLVEYDARRVKEATESGANAYHERVQEWARQVRDDTTFGGVNLDKNLKTAQLGLEKVGTTGLRSLLQPPSEKNPDGLGLGNHPEIIRLLYNVGRLYEEPALVVGQPGAADTDRERLNRLYPTMQKGA